VFTFLSLEDQLFPKESVWPFISSLLSPPCWLSSAEPTGVDDSLHCELRDFP
jgi:hypothetical protein